ncbi:MAG: hypothetical protein Q9203_000946 [Teloschistes exilis]
MSEEDDEPLVTKPFKFVTAGMLLLPAQSLWFFLPSARGHQSWLYLSSCSTYNLALFAGFDARFPNQNQTKHCWQNYVDYHKCILAKGEDFKPCRQHIVPSVQVLGVKGGTISERRVNFQSALINE